LGRRTDHRGCTCEAVRGRRSFILRFIVFWNNPPALRLTDAMRINGLVFIRSTLTDKLREDTIGRCPNVASADILLSDLKRETLHRRQGQTSAERLGDRKCSARNRYMQVQPVPSRNLDSNTFHHLWRIRAVSATPLLGISHSGHTCVSISCSHSFVRSCFGRHDYFLQIFFKCFLTSNVCTMAGDKSFQQSVIHRKSDRNRTERDIRK